MGLDGLEGTEKTKGRTFSTCIPMVGKRHAENVRHAARLGYRLTPGVGSDEVRAMAAGAAAAATATPAMITAWE